MRNPRIADVLTASYKETEQYKRQHKACLIDDIFKAKRFLYSQGEKQHNEFLNDGTRIALYDYLHELEIISLEATMKGYEKQINQIVSLKMKLA